MSFDTISIATLAIYGCVSAIGICSIAISVHHLPRRMPEELFFAAFLLIHGIVPFVAGGDRLYVTDSLIHFQAAVATLFTALSFIVTREFLRFRVMRDTPRPATVSFDSRSDIMAVLLFSIGFLALLATLYLTRGHLSIGNERLAGRSEGSFVSAILFNTSFLVLVAPWHFARRGRFVVSINFGIALCLFYMLAFPGTRLFVVYVIGSIVSGYIARDLHWRRVVFVLGTASLAIAIVSVFAYQARRFITYGWMDSITTGMTHVQFDQVPEPLNYHAQAIMAVENFQNSKDWYWGESYIRIVFGMLPEKFAFGMKPPDTNLRFAEAVDFRHNKTSVTIPPSVPGEGYINFGLAGTILSGAIYAFVFRCSTLVYQSSGRLSFVISPAIFGIAIMAVRGQLYDLVILTVVFSSVGVASILVLERLVLSRTERQWVRRPRLTGK